MYCPYGLFCFLLLLSFSTCLMVRMTDRKPKWAVVKEQEKEVKMSQSVPEEVPQTPVSPHTNQVPESVTPSTVPTSPPASTFDSIPRRREVFKKMGMDYSLFFILGPSALIPLKNTCTDLHKGNYDFHICPFRYVAQMENWKGGFRGIIG